EMSHAEMCEKKRARRDDPNLPERVAGADRENRRGGRHGARDDEARLEAGRDMALGPRSLEAREVDPRRDREPADEVGLPMQREKQDREHRVEREQGESAEDEVRAEPVDADGRHWCSPRSPMRSTTAASRKIAIASTVAIAAAQPTRLYRSAFWYMYIEGTSVDPPGPPAVVL